MHKQVVSIHVPLNKSLVLLGIPTTDDQIVFTSDEPNELLKPENFTLDRSERGLLEFLVVSSCRLFSLLDCNAGGILRLHFFCMGLFTDLEIFLDIQLCRDSKIDVNFHDLIKIAYKFIIDLNAVLISLIDCI